MIYLTSDEHVDHFNVIGFDSRPFTDVNHMREELVRRHNEVVQDEDLVLHLGDISMKHNSVPYYLQRLKGTHILYAGNHDRCFRQPKYVDIYREYGFAEVWVDPQIRYFKELGQDVLLSHLPYRDDQNERYHSKRPVDEGLLHLCGHLHIRWLTKGRQINVGVPQWNYYPVSIDQIKELCIKEGIL